MQDNMVTGAGYEGTDEYTPAGAEPSAIDKEARNVTVDGPARAAIHVQQWDAESRMFTAEMSAAGSGGGAAVSISGVAGGSKRASGGNNGASGDWADADSGRGWDESGADPICEDLGPDGGGMDFCSSQRFR